MQLTPNPIASHATPVRPNHPRTSRRPRADRNEPTNSSGSSDLAAEAATLACCLEAPRESLSVCLARIAPETFSDLRHQTLFKLLGDMFRAGKPIDIVTVNAELNLAGDLDQAGGIGYVATLPSNYVSTANLPAYLDTLCKHSVVRQTQAAAASIQKDISTENAGFMLRVFTRTLGSLHDTFTCNSAASATTVDAAQFIAKPLEYPPEIVAGVLHKGSKLVFGGSSKSYKTWVLVDLAISVSQGVSWIGFGVIQANVLYVNLEIQEPFFSRRLRMVSAAKKVELREGTFELMNLRGKAANPGFVLQEIEQRAKTIKAGLIILDPIYKLYGAEMDENSAGDVARLLNAIEALAVNTGAAVAFGAHFSKGNQAGKESMDRISGSGVFARDPDSLLVLTKHEVEGAFTLEATLRNLPPIEPFVVRWDTPLLQRDETLDPARLKKAKGRGRLHCASEILELLPPEGLLTMEWAQRAQEEAGISTRTFHNLKRELKAEGHVMQEKIKKKWKPRRFFTGD